MNDSVWVGFEYVSKENNCTCSGGWMVDTYFFVHAIQVPIICTRVFYLYSRKFENWKGILCYW